MIREQVSLDEVIELLNEAQRLDPAAISKLVDSRIEANEGLQDHPTIQCSYNEVGLLGILNGLFGTYGDRAGEYAGFGPIAAVYDHGEGTLLHFRRTLPEGEG